MFKSSQPVFPLFVCLHVISLVFLSRSHLAFADIEEPVLVDCTNRTVATPLNSSTAYVRFYRPNATDNVRVVSVNCTGIQDGGQTLSVGVYDVECVALDEAGLAGRCTFSITVEGGCGTLALHICCE